MKRNFGAIIIVGVLSSLMLTGCTTGDMRADEIFAEVNNDFKDAMGSLKDAIGDAGNDVKEAYNDIPNKIDTIKDDKDNMSGQMEEAGTKAPGILEDLQEKYVDPAKEKLEDIKDSIKDELSKRTGEEDKGE